MRISNLFKKIKENIIYYIFIFFKGKNFRIDAILIGGQRCGSTSMMQFLSQAKEVITPKNNEQLFFFSNHFDASNNYKKYHLKFMYNLIKKIVGKKVFAEKTPEYCLEDVYLDRIYNYNNNIKIIFIFREPYKRIKSAFELYKKFDYEGSFENFINDDDKKFSIKEFSLYSNIYNRIFKRFKIENVLIINFKELQTDLTKLKITKFLDIDYMNFTIPKANSFSSDESAQNYFSAINRKYGDTLEKDYKVFLDLFEKYEIKFNKYYKI